MERVFTEVRQRLQAGERMKFRVASGSMVPVIEVGELIEVEALPAGGLDHLKRFDIVLYDAGEKLFCHYLWSRNEFTEPDGSRLYVTRGLGQEEDLPIPETKILGRIISHRIPWTRRLRIALAELRGRFRGDL